MNIENIKALAEIVSANSLTSLEIEEGATMIRMERGMVSYETPTAPIVVAPPVATTPVASSAPTPAAGGEKAVDSANVTEVVSPLVGVFYSAPTPDSEPYAKIGSKVKKGDILCIIEAMKLMNEVVAEKDGEIVDVCLQNGDIAEFGQVLFKMK